MAFVLIWIPCPPIMGSHGHFGVLTVIALIDGIGGVALGKRAPSKYLEESTYLMQES